MSDEPIARYAFVATMTDQPAAFLTYVHFDDQHENGRLSELCKRLGGEIRLQTGQPFNIFQDRNNIAWGQQWRARIDDSLDAATFLIAVITPGFFRSAECRKELERFLDREKKLGRGDLILPVYYVNTPALNDEAKRKDDPLMQVIAARQYADLRDLRFEPWTSPQVGKALATMALQVAEALERRPVQQATPAPSAVAAQQQVAAPTQLAPKVEPPARVVDPFHRGHHATVTEALQAAKPGDRILVRPGLYAESIVIEKPVEIIGDGDRSDIVIDSRNKPAISFRSTMGRVANLTLRRGSGRAAGYCVDISQGRLDLEECDISSESLACVGISAGADPRLRRNVIHDGKAGGVFIYENGRGTLEDNDVFGNALAGVEISEGGNPVVRRNRIRDGKGAGVFVRDEGAGTIEDNDIFGNALTGVEISEGGNPVIRRNRIHDGKSAGLAVRDNGTGTIEDNDVFANQLSGITIKRGGNPMIRRNRIHDGKQGGVFVFDQGTGTLEDNDIAANNYSGLEVKSGGNPTVRRNKIRDGKTVGVYVNVDGLGTLEENEIIGNNPHGVEVAAGGNPTLRRNRISGNRSHGIKVLTRGQGVFERNDLRDNAVGAWLIDDEALPNLTRKDNQE